jgi:hypothetical protein
LSLLAGHPDRLSRAAGRLERWLPGRLAAALERLVARFAEGMAVLRRPAELARALALSVPLWMSIAAGIWFTARAFHITFPYTGSFLVRALVRCGGHARGDGSRRLRIAVTAFTRPEDRARGACPSRRLVRAGDDRAYRVHGAGGCRSATCGGTADGTMQE